MIRFYRILGLAVILGSITLPVWSTVVICTQNQLTRKIEVVYTDPELALPCEVLYDKRNEGSQSSLWRAENTQGYCEEKARQLVHKHQSWGWLCSEEEVTRANISTLEELTGAATKP